MASISTLVVAYRTPELTTAAVRSALAVDNVREVIVVDNGVGDETPDLLDGIGDDRVQYIPNTANTGFGQAANLAAREASGDLLLFLNSDALVTPQAVAALSAEVRRCRGRCIAGARLLEADGIIQRSAGLLPTPTDLAVRALGLHLVGRGVLGWPIVGRLARGNRLAREYDLAVTATQPIGITMVSGAVCVMGRKAFDEIGGFDEDFFMYFEDADLCRRALRAGMVIRYVPAAVVTHIGGGSSSDDYHFGPRHARSMRQYLAKWYGPPGTALAVVLMLMRAVAFSIGAPRKAGRAWRAFAATLGFGGTA